MDVSPNSQNPIYEPKCSEIKVLGGLLDEFLSTMHVKDPSGNSWVFLEPDGLHGVPWVPGVWAFHGVSFCRLQRASFHAGGPPMGTGLLCDASDAI